MTSRGAWTTSIPVSSCGGGGEVAMCPSIARAWAAWQERSYFLSVVSFTSFLTSFLVARACFLALRIFLFAWRFVFSAPLSVCSASFALSVALAAVSLTSFTLSLSANAGSARPMASAAIIPFNMFSFPFSGRPMWPAVLRQGAHAPFGAQRSGGPPASAAGLPVLRLAAGGSRVDWLLRVGGLTRHVAGTRGHPRVLVRVLAGARRGRPRHAARRSLIGGRGAGAAARVGRGTRRGARVVRCLRVARRGRRRRAGLGVVGGRRGLRAVHVACLAATLRRLTLLHLLALGGGVRLGRALVAHAGRGRRSALAGLRARRVVAVRAVVGPRLRLLRLRVSGGRLVGRRVVTRKRAVARRGVGRVAGQGTAVLIAREDGGALVLFGLGLWSGGAACIRGGLRARRERGEREGQRGRHDDLLH